MSADLEDGVVTSADLAELDLAPLPPDVAALLADVHAPPRLVAHLTLVHDTALRLLRPIRKAWPRLSFDHDLVVFGAATHDIGKARCPEELVAPGTTHEVLGEKLLLDAGVAPERARFARTHGAGSGDLPLEDVLVVLADTIWKAKRSKELDDRAVALIAAGSGAPAWDVFMRLDGILARLARDADARLAWQGRFSARG